jgi:hypothetical protein
MSEPEERKLYAVVKVSPISGRQHVLQLLLSPSQWEEIQPWVNPDPTRPKGRFIQDILADHSAAEREFIISGTTKEEWDRLWGSEGV